MDNGHGIAQVLCSGDANPLAYGLPQCQFGKVYACALLNKERNEHTTVAWTYLKNPDAFLVVYNVFYVAGTLAKSQFLQYALYNILSFVLDSKVLC